MATAQVAQFTATNTVEFSFPRIIVTSFGVVEEKKGKTERSSYRQTNHNMVYNLKGEQLNFLIFEYVNDRTRSL